MADAQGPVQPGSPERDLILERREDFGPNYRLMPNKHAQPKWPKCGHGEDAIVQVMDGPFDGGRRFFRCPYSGQMAKCNFTRWIDPPHQYYVARHVDILWNRIYDFEAQIEDLKEQNDDLRQQMQRERGNEEVVNIGSSYDPTCCCANPSCICACHYNDGQPRPRRPAGEHSMWVVRGTFPY